MAPTPIPKTPAEGKPIHWRTRQKLLQQRNIRRAKRQAKKDEAQAQAQAEAELREAFFESPKEGPILRPEGSVVEHRLDFGEFVITIGLGEHTREPVIAIILEDGTVAGSYISPAALRMLGEACFDVDDQREID